MLFFTVYLVKKNLRETILSAIVTLKIRLSYLMIPAVRYLVIFDKNVGSRFNFLPNQFFFFFFSLDFSNIKLMEQPNFDQVCGTGFLGTWVRIRIRIIS
jgi:hypothetical protein